MLLIYLFEWKDGSGINFLICCVVNCDKIFDIDNFIIDYVCFV